MSETAGELHLLFSLGADRYALPASEVGEVLPLQRLKQLPEAPAWVAGLLAHRGETVPVLDLCQRVLGRPANVRTSTRLVLVRHPALLGGRRLGLLLEQASQLQRLPREAAQAVGLAQQAQYLGEVQAAAPHGLVQRIRVAGLLPPDVAALLMDADA